MRIQEMTEFERSGDCVKLESLMYETMFSGKRLRSSIVMEMRRLWAIIKKSERGYLRKLLDVLVDADSTASERRTELAIAIEGLSAFKIVEPPLVKRKIAAGGEDDRKDDKAEYDGTLSNGWVYEILLFGDGRETELTLTLDDSAEEGPILKLRPLCPFHDGKKDYLDIDFDKDTKEVEYDSRDGKRFLYYLKGDENVLVSIPGLTETLKVVTLEYIRNNG